MDPTAASPTETSTEPNDVRIEACCGSLLDCQLAEAGGASRIELNSALPLGGLTPSTQLVRQCLESINLPIIAMIRPRPGDFFYNAREIELMRREILELAELGVAGVAWAITAANHQLDPAAMQPLTDSARARFPQLQMVYHRAFDLSPHWQQTATALVELGFDRILTSGLAPTAFAGMALLAELQSQFGQQIGVLPGSGISSQNVQEIVKQTGCTEIHGSFSYAVGHCNSDIGQFGSTSQLDPDRLAAVQQELSSMGPTR